MGAIIKEKDIGHVYNRRRVCKNGDIFDFDVSDTGSDMAEWGDTMSYSDMDSDESDNGNRTARRDENKSNIKKTKQYHSVFETKEMNQDDDDDQEASVSIAWDDQSYESHISNELGVINEWNDLHREILKIPDIISREIISNVNIFRESLKVLEAVSGKNSAMATISKKLNPAIVVEIENDTQLFPTKPQYAMDAMNNAQDPSARRIFGLGSRASHECMIESMFDVLFGEIPGSSSRQ